MSSAPGSVDPAEAARYADLAATWWDSDGPFWPLHRLNALRVQYLESVLVRLSGRPVDAAQPLAGLGILDVGCGGGLLAEALAARGADVHGIDVVERNIGTARAHAAGRLPNLAYSVSTAEALAASGARYDVVLTLEVVEHVADLPGFMRACTTLVRPGGLLGVATINRTPKAWLFAIVGAEYVLRWLPRGTHQWRRFVRPAEIDALIRPAGFTPVERRGVRVNPFTRAFSLCDSLAVNWMMLARHDGTGD